MSFMRDGFTYTDATDDAMTLLEAFACAMGWLGDGIFQYQELMRAAKGYCRARVAQA